MAYGIHITNESGHSGFPLGRAAVARNHVHIRGLRNLAIEPLTTSLSHPRTGAQVAAAMASFFSELRMFARADKALNAVVEYLGQKDEPKVK